MMLFHWSTQDLGSKNDATIHRREPMIPVVPSSFGEKTNAGYSHR